MRTDPLDYYLEYLELKSEIETKSKPAEIKMLNPDEEEAVLKSINAGIRPSNKLKSNKSPNKRLNSKLSRGMIA